MDIDSTCVTDILIAPDLIQELLAGKHTSGRRGEKIKQLQFLGRHVDMSALKSDRIIGQVDRQIRIRNDLVGRFRGSGCTGRGFVAAKYGFYPGDELF